MPVALSTASRKLRQHYGKPVPPASRDPFELIVWEQVAYLVPDAQRLKAYRVLEREVGLKPADLLSVTPPALARITRLGGSIAAPARAQRLQQSAERALRLWNGKLTTALGLPVAQARKALTAFSMIGEPGADKILLLTRTARTLALDSNALRVLQRLGLIEKHADYRTMYRGAQARLAPALPKSYEALISLSQLVRTHGQETCKTGAPRCPACPLQIECPSAAV